MQGKSVPSGRLFGEIALILLVALLLSWGALQLLMKSRPDVNGDALPPGRERGTNTNLAVVEYGKCLFALWSTSDREVVPEIGNMSGPRFIVARTFDGSAWGDAAVLSPPWHLGIHERPGAVVYNESIYAFWSEGSSIFYARYRSGNWSGASVLQAGIDNIVQYTVPVVYNGTIFLVVKLEDAPSGNPLGYLTFDGEQCSDFTVIEDNVQIRIPPAPIVYNGSLFVFWSDFSLPGIMVFNGTGWSTPVDPGSEAFPAADLYENPSAAICDGSLYIAWQRVRSNPDIREFALLRFNGSGWAVPESIFPPEDRWHWAQEISICSWGTSLDACWAVHNVTDGGHITIELFWSEKRGTTWTQRTDLASPDERQRYPGTLILVTFQGRPVLFYSFGYRTFDGANWSQCRGILP